jgi:hypothetical protein
MYLSKILPGSGAAWVIHWRNALGKLHWLPSEWPKEEGFEEGKGREVDGKRWTARSLPSRMSSARPKTLYTRQAQTPKGVSQQTSIAGTNPAATVRGSRFQCRQLLLGPHLQAGGTVEDGARLDGNMACSGGGIRRLLERRCSYVRTVQIIVVTHEGTKHELVIRGGPSHRYSRRHVNGTLTLLI